MYGHPGLCQLVRMDEHRDDSAEVSPVQASRGAIGAERRMRWLISVCALVLGAGAATAVFLLLGDDEKPAAKPWVPPAAESPVGGNEYLDEPSIQKYCLDRGGKQTVIVYFDGDDPDAAMNQAADTLRDDDRVASVKTETRQQAYQRFTEVFADQPELVELARPEALPASVTLLPAADVHPGDLADAVTAEFPELDSLGAGCELPK